MAVVAVDLGGTKIVAALVDDAGTVTGHRRSPTPATLGPDAVLDTVARLVIEVSGDTPRPVGVGAAGLIDTTRGVVVSSTDALAGWAGTPVVAGLRSRLDRRWPGGVAVRVGNDVDAHAIGEAWRGAAQGRRSMLMVAVGTGVGAAVVTDGRAWRGAHWGAGEIGHAPTPGAEGLSCSCGRPGHLEAIASGPAIAARYRRATGEDVDAREVVGRAGAGDGTARVLVAEAATALGRALAGQVTMLDPDVVVLGGGLTGAGALWWDTVVATLRAELVDVLREVEVAPAALGPDAALLGAARMVL